MTAKDVYTGAQIVAAVWIIGLAVPVKAVVVGVEEVRGRLAGKNDEEGAKVRLGSGWAQSSSSPLPVLERAA